MRKETARNGKKRPPSPVHIDPVVIGNARGEEIKLLLRVLRPTQDLARLYYVHAHLHQSNRSNQSADTDEGQNGVESDDSYVSKQASLYKSTQAKLGENTEELEKGMKASEHDMQPNQSSNLIFGGLNPLSSENFAQVLSSLLWNTIKGMRQDSSRNVTIRIGHNG